ncbi:MAG: hypothetical protein U0792_24780 [Gemmataceae bacterium]
MMRWARKSSGLIYFLNGQGELRSVRAPGTFGLSGRWEVPEPNRINFQAKMTARTKNSPRCSCSAGGPSPTFYDSKHHADWDTVRAKFQPSSGTWPSAKTCTPS